MNGFWRMIYTDYSPSGPSSGQLGPFVGDVFQDLDAPAGRITNILRVDFPPVLGGLVAFQSVQDPVTWYHTYCNPSSLVSPSSLHRRIQFDRVGNTFGGMFTPPPKLFPPGKEVRLWQVRIVSWVLKIFRPQNPFLRTDHLPGRGPAHHACEACRGRSIRLIPLYLLQR